jgi:hypothetical protein
MYLSQAAIVGVDINIGKTASPCDEKRLATLGLSLSTLQQPAWVVTCFIAHGFAFIFNCVFVVNLRSL